MISFFLVVPGKIDAKYLELPVIDQTRSQKFNMVQWNTYIL